MIDALRSDENLLGELVALLLLLVPFALAVVGLYRGYAGRRAREEEQYGPLPVTDPPNRPADADVLYTGTTIDGTPIAKIAAHRLFGRGACRVWIENGGVVFHRVHGPVVAIRTIRVVGLAGAHAGRVLAPGRIAIVGWTLGGHDVDTGFAFGDAASAAAFAAAVANAAGLPAGEEVRDA